MSVNEILGLVMLLGMITGCQIPEVDFSLIDSE